MVSLRSIFSADATAASTTHCYSFYHTIIKHDPISRQYSIENLLSNPLSPSGTPKETTGGVAGIVASTVYATMAPKL